ncbi:hypothetical protein KXD40_003941 [Peronospora effusa]|uniref:Uncharacterized protein n=1 Tax=Peronospora effusa TaxID=542832 RepID=A0A3R7XGZ4_9STRA|nr:hypothetical protein DD237_000291 [Peronospora effusa]UIZ22963.1 hypothetical protein KXD40_003941 [Peronospora effusa]
MTRGGIPTVKKAVSISEAPIWKSYLALRSLSSSDVVNASNTADLVTRCCVNGHYCGRKRAKPSTGRGALQGASIWMTLVSPLTTRQSNKEDGDAVLRNIRHYWEQLSVNERQQILFLDEPEQVKQLYKLNLSLLCVGLMQRHLMTSNRTGVASTDKKIATASASMTTKTIVVTTAPTVQERAATLPPTREVSDISSEKTYELLEAMEFMDISTGILTVKTELAEDTDRLFTLVGDVLEGFLTSIHVLTENNFHKLFVAESETINTWANYQRLIAMLVEQLILRSYVSHLERKAAQQMEQLLLEVSLEDTNMSTSKLTSYGKKKVKKKKKRKSTRHGDPLTQQTDTLNTAMRQSKEDENPGRIRMEGDDSTASSSRDEILVVGSVGESMPEAKLISADSDCGSMVPTESIHEAISEVRTSTRKVSSLNPNALVFQPQPATEDYDARTLSVGKRKLDEYIINVPWEDVDSDVGSAFDNQSIDRDLSGEEEEEVDDKSICQRWRRKQRRSEEDAELERQLQQVYATTSCLFGWDFLRQCKLPDGRTNLPWSESMLWRTAPKEVVRYFSPGNGDECSRFHASHFLSPVPSRYYFKPGPPMSFGSPLLYIPGLESPLDESFGFEPSMVVSSPDFFNAQYHPRYHDE